MCCLCIIIVVIINGTVSTKIAPRICYTNASRLNRYNFPTVNAIDFLFSILHTTPFHYGETYFGALHQFLADAKRSDIPWGSKPPHLQVGAFKSLQIQYVRTGVLLLLMCSVRQFLLYPSRRYSCAKLMHISRSIAPFLHATRVPFSQSTINFDNFFVPPISPLN